MIPFLRRWPRRYCHCGHQLGRYYGERNDERTRYDGRGNVMSERWWWLCPLRTYPWGGGPEHISRPIGESGARRRLRLAGVRPEPYIHAGAWNRGVRDE